MSRIFSIVTQTNKHFYGLIMNARGIPKEGTKECSPPKTQKVHSQRQSKKAKALHCYKQEWYSRNGISSLPQKCETPPVTYSLICSIEQALLEWDFPSTNKAMKLETTKAPYGLERLMKNFSESCHSWTKSHCLWLNISDPSLFDWPPRFTPVNATFQMVKTDRIFLLVTKLSFQDITETKRKNSDYFWEKKKIDKNWG